MAADRPAGGSRAAPPEAQAASIPLSAPAQPPAQPSGTGAPPAAGSSSSDPPSSSKPVAIAVIPAAIPAATPAATPAAIPAAFPATVSEETKAKVAKQMEAESSSRPRSRLTRLVEEVEAFRNNGKEVKIRNEEKAKLQVRSLV